MKREDWRRAYEPLPESLEGRVAATLAHLETGKPVRKRSLRTAVIALALLFSLCGVAYGVYESVTANLFGWFYGGSWKEERQNGDIAPMGQSRPLGDVSYTIEEMVYKSDGDFKGLYGVVRVRPAEGANVVLLPEDLSVNDPAGYVLHYGDTGQNISDEAPSYAELAKEKDAKLLVAGVAVNSLLVDGTDCLGGCYGLSSLPQADGSVLITLEMTDSVPRADSYELNLALYSWEVTQEGYSLREGPESTWLEDGWATTVTPEMKGEGA